MKNPKYHRYCRRLKARSATSQHLLQRKEFLVRPERFELPTLWFEAKCSIQLSYGRTMKLALQDNLPPAPY